MSHTPGQRVHSVEGPGRQSTSKCLASTERLVNTGDPPVNFKRRTGTSTSLPNAARDPSPPNVPLADRIREQQRAEAAEAEIEDGEAGEEAAQHDQSNSLWLKARDAMPADAKRTSFGEVVGDALEAKKQEWKVWRPPDRPCSSGPQPQHPHVAWTHPSPQEKRLMREAAEHFARHHREAHIPSRLPPPSPPRPRPPPPPAAPTALRPRRPHSALGSVRCAVLSPRR